MMLTRGAQVTGVAVCSLCLTWISVSLRFYVRVGILKFFGREDWLTLAAMVLFTTFCALLLVAEGYGLGAHMYAIPEDMMESGLKYIFICELLYVATTTVTKLSIGAFYFRLANKKYQFRIIKITLMVVMIFSTMYFFFILLQCTPVNHYWTQFSDNSGSCINSDVLINVTYAHATMSAVTDWSLGLLPIFFVRKLKMNPRTKLSIILILSLGFFASSATFVRIIYIRQLQLTTDYSWFGINLVKWSMVEPAIGITAAAIATLRPLFANFLKFTQKKRFTIDSETSLSEDIKGRLSTSSKRSGQEYSAEFAEMMGLEKYGVTTHISAAKPPGWRGRRRLAMLAKAGNDDSDSQMELSHGPPDTSGFGMGIHMTTVVVIEKA